MRLPPFGGQQPPPYLKAGNASFPRWKKRFQNAAGPIFPEQIGQPRNQSGLSRLSLDGWYTMRPDDWVIVRSKCCASSVLVSRRVFTAFSMFFAVVRTRFAFGFLPMSFTRPLGVRSFRM